ARRFPARMLYAHNMVRARAGAAPLQWDDRLGREAANYAVQLALSGTFAHSASRSRNGAGENLWMGTAGAFSPEAMVASWESEKRLFAGGVFPNVSRNGNWHEIGHYTQMVWPTTRRVGCALATSAWADYLVCRYSPAGNVMGTALYVRPAALTPRPTRRLWRG
ncbi:MAG TPA: CAP domain-containing protein, partial [Vicinamibacterales bacterium]|nr:CAP domain-containing protein [Vicinamibacterales bacterium]